MHDPYSLPDCPWDSQREHPWIHASRIWPPGQFLGLGRRGRSYPLDQRGTRHDVPALCK
ncbi:hypothetical protein QFZ98_003524 [Paraburkholderia youngii]